MPTRAPTPTLNAPIFLRGLAYHVEELAPVEEIPALAADTKLLSSFWNAGFRTYARSQQTLAQQAIASAKKSLAAAHLSARDLDAIVIGTSEMREHKRYPEMLATEMLLALEISDVPVVGVSLAGCANWASGLRVARNMLVAEGMKNILVVETDQVRGDMQRLSYDDAGAIAIFADGAASVIASADAGDFELVASSQTIKPLDWHRAPGNVIAANTVLGFRHVVDDALARAGLSRADVAATFLSNINAQIVQDIAAAVELPSVSTANSARTAHVWSCDNLINLADHCAAAAPPAGTTFLLVCNAESYFSAIVVKQR